MNPFYLAVPILYYLLVLGLCGFLLARGIAHVFVGLFAGGALLHLIQSLGYAVLSQAPGGYGGNARYFPILVAFGTLGTLFFALGFVMLTGFLIRAPKSDPAGPVA